MRLFLPISLALATANAFNITQRAADDVTECEGKGQVAYQDAFSIAQAFAASSPGTSWESGVPFRSRNAQAVYLNQGFGATIGTETLGDIIFDILQSCWTQQAQNKNLPGAGFQNILSGTQTVGVVCLSANGVGCPF